MMIYQVLLEVKYAAQMNNPQEYVFTSYTYNKNTSKQST
jgi:hypothetical protein